MDNHKALARTDPLTAIPNRRAFYDLAEMELNKARRYQSPLSVLYVDIDNFKSIVDKYGHLLGTRVLKEIGETISSNLSKEDILIKYGGDEYIIILPDRSKPQAVILSENILSAIRETTYLESEAEPARVTASIGIATYPEDAETKKELLILADNALFKVKSSRKNRVGTA